MRLCTIAENVLNRGKYSNNTSGITGVYWSKQRGKWQALITRDKKGKHLGFFDDKETAAAARRAAEREVGQPSARSG